MARKKVAPEEEIVNAAGEEVIPERILWIPYYLMRSAQIPKHLPQICRRGIFLRRKRQSSRRRFLQWRQPRRSRLDYLQQKKLHPKKKMILL